MPNFDQTGRGGNRLFHGAFNGMGRGRRCRGSGRNAFHMGSPQYSCDMQQRGHSRSGMSSGMNFSARNTQGSGWLGARIDPYVLLDSTDKLPSITDSSAAAAAKIDAQLSKEPPETDEVP